MAKITFLPLPDETVARLRNGGPDAYGQAPERVRSEGGGNPCRHCLDFVPEGAEMLILAFRPFGAPQPYAETGPIFLCAGECASWGGAGVPPILTSSPDYLLKGYTADERILYGTGKVVPRDEVECYAAALLDRPEIAFVDVRSARNNCFQTRIVRREA
ncbi:DUF1203 domain-containing protein [Salipiger mangrovisoli]|uniref:DUF1203 domain-containing protein n=1 Tax=Salipiger mangrovisoli TaxID=2865933 RepID=A0ABR9X2K2_9RHOB|nr:DUF1203 domain-containing protein [Salipiger mangrovisoli]MBE9637700.1 DUF1203 domain-containing protein [Salipiger mangrovisoli]